MTKKQIALVSITAAMVTLIAVSIFLIDIYPIKGSIVTAIAGTWLALFIYANID